MDFSPIALFLNISISPSFSKNTFSEKIASKPIMYQWFVGFELIGLFFGFFIPFKVEPENFFKKCFLRPLISPIKSMVFFRKFPLQVFRA